MPMQSAISMCIVKLIRWQWIAINTSIDIHDCNLHPCGCARWLGPMQ